VDRGYREKNMSYRLIIPLIKAVEDKKLTKVMKKTTNVLVAVAVYKVPQ
jgi:ribosomal protein L12E/L44/L45/RPP1/RPP2